MKNFMIILGAGLVASFGVLQPLNYVLATKIKAENNVKIAAEDDVGEGMGGELSDKTGEDEAEEGDDEADVEADEPEISEKIPEIFIKAVNPGYSGELGSNVGEMIEIARKNADEPLALAGATVSYTNSSGNESVLLEFPENS